MNFIKALYQIPEGYKVPLVCHIARILHEEKTSNQWNLVMTAALYIGTDPKPYDSEAEQTIREIIIESGKGPEVLKHLNETYLPQVHESAVMWSELIADPPFRGYQQ